LRHHVERTLSYTPEQLFALVGDVDAYPQFVPWIQSMRTWNARTEGDGVSLVDAQAGVGFSFLKEKFSTRVRRDAKAKQIDVQLLSGPFKRLANRWRFVEAPGGTKIDFEIDFEFKSRLLAGLLAANFHNAVDKLMTCFEARALALYGPPAQLSDAP
jgi:coenzyme Q-binding protein COQ10